MKKFSLFSLTIAILIAVMWITSPVMVAAADEVVDTTIQSTVQKRDKNGQDYVRFIIPIERTLNGISYNDTVAVNAYPPLVTEAAGYKSGQKLHAIVGFREFNGRQYGTILKFLPPTQVQ
jgi:hypothetical protein